jgi:hypothetical protein
MSSYGHEKVVTLFNSDESTGQQWLSDSKLHTACFHMDLLIYVDVMRVQLTGKVTS